MRAGGALGILLIIIAFILFPLLLNSFGELPREEVTSSSSVITGVAETTGNMTLNSGLYEDNVDHVVSIDSSDDDDLPVASEYNSVTKALVVTGLDDSSTRSLEATYYTERDDDYTSSLSSVAPFLIFASLLVSGIAVAWRSYS